MSDSAPRILYCHCQYAQVVPKEVKETVLRRLCESGLAFEAVADLCEMAARRDPALAQLAAAGEQGGIKIAACFPRAVKGLFHQAGADLPLASTEILNMRTRPGEEVATALLAPEMGRSAAEEFTADHADSADRVAAPPPLSVSSA